LTNTEDNGHLGKTGYLIHIRVLENITKNLQDLTGSLSVLEAAFKNNESLLQKENELRLGAEKQVEELLVKFREREAQDSAIAEVVQFEKELEVERQNLEKELKQAEQNLEDARKDGDYYDPADPTQEKAKTKIEQQVEEMKKIENAIQDLESERERLAQVRNL
jgi:creatinine amidohydrolase/Fe(II)-dependent formamide hydrolase-like protein